mmetsp:Transcript_30077/g.43735  ORF Transcript_30077/g.43735 Transcript_30077/m.43735 type:complete len:454 (+) Transcript_30077:228-1589(+)
MKVCPLWRIATNMLILNTSSSAALFVTSPCSLMIRRAMVTKQTASFTHFPDVVGLQRRHFKGYNHDRMDCDKLSSLSMNAMMYRQKNIFSSLGSESIFRVGRNQYNSLSMLSNDSFLFEKSREDKMKQYSTTTSKSSKEDSPFDEREMMLPKEERKKKKNKKNKKEKTLFRVDRILSNRGIGSRSETHLLIKEKRITTFDPQTQQHTLVKGPSVRLPIDTVFYIDRTHELPGPIPKILIFHKPKYVLSETMDRTSSSYHSGDEEKGRKHVYMFLEERYQKKKNSGLHPVGRLDYDSSGLLLFSSDGSLTQRLLHPRHEVEKEYVATVEGMSWDGIEAKEDELREMLNKGVETTEGVHTAKLLGVEPLMMVQKKEEEAKEPPTKEQESVPLTNVRLIVQEGKYRMVRRMLANCGYPVIELKRIRHGEVTLNDLEVGQFRVATSEELKWIESLLV